MSIDEYYKQFGVVHGEECQICQFVEQNHKYKKPRKNVFYKLGVKNMTRGEEIFLGIALLLGYTIMSVLTITAVIGVIFALAKWIF